MGHGEPARSHRGRLTCLPDRPLYVPHAEQTKVVVHRVIPVDMSKEPSPCPVWTQPTSVRGRSPRYGDAGELLGTRIYGGIKILFTFLGFILMNRKKLN